MLDRYIQVMVLLAAVGAVVVHFLKYVTAVGTLGKFASVLGHTIQQRTACFVKYSISTIRKLLGYTRYKGQSEGKSTVATIKFLSVFVTFGGSFCI